MLMAERIQLSRKKHLRKLSDNKQSSQMFQQTLENIELEKMRGENKTIEAEKAITGSNQKFKCFTPDKRAASNRKPAEMIYSSNKKISSFETPRGNNDNRIGGKHRESLQPGELQYTAQKKCAYEDDDVMGNDQRIATEAKRKLMIKSNSSLPNSN